MAVSTQSPIPSAERGCTGHTAARFMDPDGTVALIAEIVAKSPRLAGALCRGRAELFSSDDADDIATAIDVCRRCPSLSCCAEWLQSLPRSRRPIGVVAGQVEPVIGGG